MWKIHVHESTYGIFFTCNVFEFKSARKKLASFFFLTRVHFTGYRHTDDISLQILSLTHEEITCTWYMLYAASFAENIYISPPELKATAHSVRNLLVQNSTCTKLIKKNNS